MEPTYAVRTSDDTVEAWSTARLPFEPKGTLLQFRDELRTALGSLSPCPGAGMHATYGAADDGQFVDTENVLLYNVGTSHLRHLAARAITFERAFTYPTPPGESGMRPDRLHYVRYVVGPTADLSHWASAGRIAAFEDVDVSSLAKPGPTWAAIRTQSAPPSPRLGAPQRFLVRLRIRDRRPAHGTNLAGLIKPVLDGVISAFHSHVGEADHVSRRLAEAGVGEYTAVRRALRDSSWGALGPRPLVRPFGARGVQWNPADDYCVAASVELDPAPAAGLRWQFSGELLRVRPR